MKHTQLRFVVIILIGILFAQNMVGTYAFSIKPTVSCNSVSSNTMTQGIEGNYVDDEVLIIFEKKGITKLENYHGVMSDTVEYVLEQVENENDAIPYALVELQDNMDVEEAISYYEQLPGVDYVQPNYIYELEENSTQYDSSTNDLYYLNQWYLTSTGVDKAWDMLEGVDIEPTLVCVLDTGLDINHEDIQTNIDLKHSVNIAEDGYPKVISDLDSHGTHVAGTIAAVNNNNIGVAGIGNNRVKVASVCVFNSELKASTENAVKGVNYAISINAKVINMSFGNTTYDQAFDDVCTEAANRNITIICSAGNKGVATNHYPSGYDGTLGIINSGLDDKKTSGSNYGEKNFMCAPGTSIYSTIPLSSYGYKSGSSMASAVASGVVALMYSVDNTLTCEEVKTILKTTTKDIYEEGFDPKSGWGIVNTEAAIRKTIELKNDKERSKLPQYVLEPKNSGEFVQKMYYVLLNRDAEQKGFDDWNKKLQAKEITGAELVEGFVYSKEYINKNQSEEAFLTDLYMLFFGRKPDRTGKEYWMSKIERGVSRKLIINGFAGSDEFKKVCKICNIEPGQVSITEARDYNDNFTAYIKRLYINTLNRNCSSEELNYWCALVNSGEIDLYNIATKGFFASKEFSNRNLSDEEYLNILYKTFLDRKPDTEGYQYWLNNLSSKKITREQALNGFADSREFANLMAKYYFPDLF